jgi:transglutaminase-like putative cysteine protease
MDIQITHATRYRYLRPVRLGPHRLMLRPRDSFDVRLLRTGLTLSPPARLTWMHDAYSNSVAIATFDHETDELSIVSELVLRRYQPRGPQPATAPWRNGAAIAYSNDERLALAPYLAPVSADDHGETAQFAAGAVAAGRVGQGHPLLDLSAFIHDFLSYRMRFEEGTQVPLQTLETRTGSCRDYAWLFIECARHLGYAARFVTGYLHNVGMSDGASLIASVGFSHAWAEVYVPGDGWVEFDPTNLLVADRQLIRIAVTRTPGEASSVRGSFMGMPQVVQPEVSVVIRPADDT